MKFTVNEGNYAQLGARILESGVVFTFCGEKEDACNLILIDKKTKEKTTIEVPADYCLGSLRSICVSIDKPERYLYLYQINGEDILDPYATCVVGREKWNDSSRESEDYQVYAALCSDDFTWGDDTFPEISKADCFMYKLHVRGFSMGGGVSKKLHGTFAAIQSRLPYLKELGVTTIECMPVYEFEEMTVEHKKKLPDYVTWNKEDEDLITPDIEPEVTANAKVNYWGYGPGNYFAVKASYAQNPLKATQEYKELIRNMHLLGMECVMEMFFPETTNQNLILDALRFWVKEYHVDGFHLLGNKLPITAIAQDIMLSRTKIYYTDFDESVLDVDKKYKNLYIYKDEYLYPARKILNHINPDMVEFMNQQKKQGTLLGYVNYISSNNGFTLADVFQYNDRHNEANGENNEDGNSWNFSNNYGVEGQTRKKYVLELRRRQWRNAVLMLFLAQGVPMLFEGDECANSQSGNNNAYCQDNAIGWVNWKKGKESEECLSFIKAVVKFRKEHSMISECKPYHFSDYKSFGLPDVSYHGESAWISGFDMGKMNLGVMYNGDYAEPQKDEILYVAYNFYSARSTLALPKLSGKKKWYLCINTFDANEPVKMNPELVANQQTLQISPQSICVLVGREA